MTANDIDINDQCFSPIPRISGDEIKPRNIINISLLQISQKAGCNIVDYLLNPIKH